MDTNKLKKFAQGTRNLLIDQVSSKLDMVLDAASATRRENPEAVKDLEGVIGKTDTSQVIEKVAYTWFNRFTALRFMDVNGYTSIRVVSPTEGQTRPEILSEAMAGHIDDSVAAPIKEKIVALLDGLSPSSDPQGEAYRLLLVASCNQWHGSMPFLFEKIDDYTELLMPEDLLSRSSILAELREVMTEEACQDVEVIGWLYQFYISQKKDEIFAGLKKNKKITAENIPAATQLFTPHWIVRYLVENSLGRLWLLNKPESKLAQKMDYYIAPAEPESDYLRVSKPEEIRICDPAAGSGHMLTYAFDLLYAIYEEEGYDATDIPTLILTHNLTGVEIDDRAGALAAFALTMKAAAKLGRRRFLRMQAKPDICVLQNVAFTDAEMQDVMTIVGNDLFTDELRETLGQFEQAKNFGSLIVPQLRDPDEMLRVVEARDFGSDLLLKDVQARVVSVLHMAEVLSPRYHVVVANPPYMGNRNMSKDMAAFLKTNFDEYKLDVFTCFAIRSKVLTLRYGNLGFMTPFTWMFIGAYEEFRDELINHSQIQSLVQLEYSGFDGATVPICIFNFSNRLPSQPANFIRLVRFKGSQNQGPRTLEAIRQKNCPWHFSANPKDFNSIPGKPIAYWISENMRRSFESAKIEDLTISDGQTKTGDNGKYLRFTWEVTSPSVGKDRKWVPYAKGGGFRRWSGNLDEVVNWSSEARNHYRKDNVARIMPEYLWWRVGITWGMITSALPSFRFLPEEAIFDVGGSSVFFHNDADLDKTLLFLNSCVSTQLLKITNPTLNFQVKNIRDLPLFAAETPEKNAALSQEFQKNSKSDWDAFETSWDFSTLPLLSPDHRADTLGSTYTRLRAHWKSLTDEMQRLEEENNRIFIDAYRLQDELTHKVPVEEITLTCNPAYRYGVKGTEEDRETRLRADTMAEFLSYAVGCMFGRYSLDAPGLILANQGETRKHYLARVPEPTFMPDDDNVIPVLDGDWFPDDITERFRLFLRTTFGEEHFRENLKYIEDSLGKDIRKYFARDFYADHVKRYKKRPIYWMFSSPKGTFNALIYMHRYRADTVSVLLNDYLREFINKLEAGRSRLEKLSDDESANQSRRTKALKDATKITTQLDELRDWERDVIFPLAQQKIEIDLDDGVKANYPKFSTALKKIPGVSE